MKDYAAVVKYIRLWLSIFVVFMSVVALFLLGIYINEHFTNDIWSAIYILAVFSAFIAFMVEVSEP